MYNCRIRFEKNRWVVRGDRKQCRNDILFEGLCRRECEDFIAREGTEYIEPKRFRFRKVSSLKKQFDKLERMRDRGEISNISIEHGAACYGYTRCIHVPEHYDEFGRRIRETLEVYTEDFMDGNREMLFMEVTDETLRVPKSNGDDYYLEFVSASWTDEFPSIMTMSEYRCLS